MNRGTGHIPLAHSPLAHVPLQRKESPWLLCAYPLYWHDLRVDSGKTKGCRKCVVKRVLSSAGVAPVAFLALLFASLPLISGCGAEESSSPQEDEPMTTNQSETTHATNTASTLDESSTLTIISSDGTRTELQVEIADEEAELQRGLMERTALAEDAGMLFVFDQEQPLSFWMKDTLIPLSIAYISAEERIVDIQDMQPLDETPHPSAEPAQYALEVNQGFFAEHNIGVGDVVELPDRPG